MDKQRLKQLAGITITEDFDGFDAGEIGILTDTQKQVDAAEKALHLIMKIEDPDERMKQWNRVAVRLKTLNTALSNAKNRITASH